MNRHLKNICKNTVVGLLYVSGELLGSFPLWGTIFLENHNTLVLGWCDLMGLEKFPCFQSFQSRCHKYTTIILNPIFVFDHLKAVTVHIPYWYFNDPQIAKSFYKIRNLYSQLKFWYISLACVSSLFPIKYFLYSRELSILRKTKSGCIII